MVLCPDDRSLGVKNSGYGKEFRTIRAGIEAIVQGAGQRPASCILEIDRESTLDGVRSGYAPPLDKAARENGPNLFQAGNFVRHADHPTMASVEGRVPVVSSVVAVGVHSPCRKERRVFKAGADVLGVRVGVGAEKLQTVTGVFFDGDLKRVVVRESSVGDFSSTSVSIAVIREILREEGSQTGTVAHTVRIRQADRNVRRNDRIKCMGSDQFFTMRTHISKAKDCLERNLPLKGEVIVKRMGCREVLGDNTQVWSDCELCEIYVRCPRPRWDVRKFIRDGKSAGDVLKRIGKRGIVEI